MLSGLNMAFTEVGGPREGVPWDERSSLDAEGSLAAAAAAFESRFVGFGGMVSVSFLGKSQADLFVSAFVSFVRWTSPQSPKHRPNGSRTLEL